MWWFRKHKKTIIYIAHIIVIYFVILLFFSISTSTAAAQGIPAALAFLPSVPNYSYSDISYALTSSFMTKIKYFRGIMIKNIFCKNVILKWILLNSRLKGSWSNSREQLWFLSTGCAPIKYNLVQMVPSFIVILISSRQVFASGWSQLGLPCFDA